ncbi:hypothetical protein [Chryseobacterium ginsengisoli]
MTKKMISWLSILTVFLTLFGSCHNEDFANSETNPQRNNANFFKHINKGGINAKSGVDYISILEAYNREKDFLSTIPDQKGMPIWDKMQVVDAENATGLMIPLSDDNETMSSVLFATLDDENSIIGVRDYDNKLLENIVYSEKIDKDFREQMFYTFMYMDNKTFGNEDFTNIPKDLFVGKKYNNEYGRMRIKNLTTSTATIQQNGKMIWLQSCGVYWQCSHHGEGKCDNCMAKCHVNICYDVVISVPDGDATPQIPNTSGGGDGGGGTPGPQPPKDPCTQSGTAFYRISQQCSENDDTGIVIDETPCQKIITENTKAKNLLDQAVIAAQNTIMKIGISTSTIEKGFIFGKDASGNYKTSNIILGDSSGAQVDLPPTHTDFTAEGGIHDHTIKTYEVPSTGDIYWFMQNNYQNPNFDYYLINGAEGTTYACVVTNQSDFDNFPLTHPPSQYFSSEDNAWNPTKDIGKDFDLSEKYFKDIGKSDEEAKELAMAFVIGKYNTGMGLSKKDSNGNFQPIFVKEIEIQVPTGNTAFPFIVVTTYEKITDCNLK